MFIIVELTIPCLNISMEMSRGTEMNIKNRGPYFFNGMMNINNLDPNNIKIDEKSHKNILIYCIGYVTPSSVKPLYLIINYWN